MPSHLPPGQRCSLEQESAGHQSSNHQSLNLQPSNQHTAAGIKGRGAVSNAPSRYLQQTVVRDVEQEWDEDPASSPRTELLRDASKSIIATNRSPDVPFSQSINPYKGCEHGCIYCFARPTHAYWDLSPGLDFETKIFYKPEGPALLKKALAKPRYRCSPIAFGTNTDPYQPVDRELAITRQLLEVLQGCHHPFSLVTKGSHVLRDLDIMADMAQRQLCSVMVSITTLDNNLKRSLEPRTASPANRLRLVQTLADAGVPVGVMVAPVIPMINDRELEAILAAAREAGAEWANYILLRLPLEVKDLFSEWLHVHYPQRAEHVLSLIRQSRDGKLNQAEFGQRMRGEGVFAELINRRFHKAARRFGLNQTPRPSLETRLFIPPGREQQLSLF